MKKILVLLFVLTLASCEIVVAPTPAAQNPEYTPPSMGDVKAVNILRYPSGVVTKSLLGNGKAEADPLFAACDDPGTVYMFYDDNALVQYVPKDGFYQLFSSAAKLTVELHNSTNPSELWDYVSVSLPGPNVDYSHDPAVAPLEAKFLDNDGNIVLNAAGSPGHFIAADATEYQTYYANADGSPKLTMKGTFEAYGANDGIHVLHIIMGGDGISIPPSTFAYY